MSNKGEIINWSGFQSTIGVDHAIGYSFSVTGEPNKHGNWFIEESVLANKRHDFAFYINGEQFELTGAEMLEALRSHAAARVIKGERG